MNAFSAIANIYVFMTIAATVILVHSFRHSFDSSARYFLSAEILLTMAACLVSYLSFYPHAISPATNGIHNFFTLSAETMVFFSVVALHKKVRARRVFGSTLLIAFSCVVLEILRVRQGLILANSLYMIVYISISLLTIFQCFQMPDADLKNNRFLKWFGIFQAGIALFYVTRLLANLSGMAIHFREVTVTSVTFFSVLISCNVFRYISYIALRATWVDPASVQKNALNERLVRSMAEKDQLLVSLTASNRLIGISTLASALAHQLSQPLTALALQAGAMKRSLAARLEKDDSLMEPLNEICLQSDYLSRVVSNLRQLFQSQDIERRQLNLKEVTGQIVEIVQPMFESQNMALELHNHADPEVYGDKIQIQQVLINLLNNAAEAVVASESAQKTVSISIDRNEACGIVRVQDSGAGVPPELLPHVFELYQTTKKDGLGIGLWLCKMIMDRHQGHIAAANTPGSGACFEVQIPLQAQGGR